WLFAELAERSGGAVPAQPVDELIAVLVREGVLIDALAPAISPNPRASGRRVVLAISGAIAAVDAPVLVRGLHALGCEVRIALTKTAQRFVAIAALDALTHHRVWRGIWQRDERAPVPHINLAEWAELVIVWPASATTISRIAAGDCSDLVSAVVTATRAPVIVAPSMNDAMLGSPAVQTNLDALRTQGRWIVHGTLGVEVAHRPEDRVLMFGPAAPASAIVDIARHVLAQFPRPALPEGAAAWEQLWSTTPLDQLPWTHDPIDAPLAAALASHATPGARLLDLGTGTGIVAIAAAKLGYRVIATEISATALGRARGAAPELPILFALDDVTCSQLDGAFDVIADRGVLHCLPPAHRSAWAVTITSRCAPGGHVLVVVHQGRELSTHPITAAELAALLPELTVVATTPTTLSGGPALLVALQHSR
nr:methyltransferase domain-containing protein [Deltaproteobacteria bacterium]